MNDFFPEEPKKLKERISRYKRQLKKGDRDGAGKRYLVGPMYQLLGNNDGALEYYNWFKKEYEDDSGEPYMCICWALALYQGGLKAEAVKKLQTAMLSNLYLIPLLLNKPLKKLDAWLGSNWEWQEYAEEVPQELLRLWGDEEKSWADQLYYSPEFVNDRKRYIEIHEQLKGLPPSQKRSDLVMESHSMRYGNDEDVEVPHLRLVKSESLR
jgi:hypothetical protein